MKLVAKQKESAPVAVLKDGSYKATLTNVKQFANTTHGLRHIGTTQRTTIRMEWQFWAQIDLLANKAGRHWRELVELELTDKPVGHGAASWLRVRCLLLTKKEVNHGDEKNGGENCPTRG